MFSLQAQRWLFSIVIASNYLQLGPVVDLNGVRIGLLICADISYPEAARALALQDADIIIVPTAQAAVPAMNGYSNMTIPSVII